MSDEAERLRAVLAKVTAERDELHAAAEAAKIKPRYRVQLRLDDAKFREGGDVENTDFGALALAVLDLYKRLEALEPKKPWGA